MFHLTLSNLRISSKMSYCDHEVGEHVELNGVKGVIQARTLHTGSDEGTGYTYEV